MPNNTEAKNIYTTLTENGMTPGEIIQAQLGELRQILDDWFNENRKDRMDKRMIIINEILTKIKNTTTLEAVFINGYFRHLKDLRGNDPIYKKKFNDIKALYNVACANFNNGKIKTVLDIDFFDKKISYDARAKKIFYLTNNENQLTLPSKIISQRVERNIRQPSSSHKLTNRETIIIDDRNKDRRLNSGNQLIFTPKTVSPLVDTHQLPFSQKYTNHKAININDKNMQRSYFTNNNGIFSSGSILNQTNNPSPLSGIMQGIEQKALPILVTSQEQINLENKAPTQSEITVHSEPSEKYKKIYKLLRHYNLSAPHLVNELNEQYTNMSAIEIMAAQLNELEQFIGLYHRAINVHNAMLVLCPLLLVSIVSGVEKEFCAEFFRDAFFSIDLLNEFSTMCERLIALLSPEKSSHYSQPVKTIINNMKLNWEEDFQQMKALFALAKKEFFEEVKAKKERFENAEELYISLFRSISKLKQSRTLGVSRYIESQLPKKERPLIDQNSSAANLFSTSIFVTGERNLPLKRKYDQEDTSGIKQGHSAQNEQLPYKKMKF